MQWLHIQKQGESSKHVISHLSIASNIPPVWFYTILHTKARCNPSPGFGLLKSGNPTQYIPGHKGTPRWYKSRGLSKYLGNLDLQLTCKIHYV